MRLLLLMMPSALLVAAATWHADSTEHMLHTRITRWCKLAHPIEINTLRSLYQQGSSISVLQAKLVGHCSRVFDRTTNFGKMYAAHNADSVVTCQEGDRGTYENEGNREAKTQWRRRMLSTRVSPCRAASSCAAEAKQCAHMAQKGRHPTGSASEGPPRTPSLTASIIGTAWPWQYLLTRHLYTASPVLQYDRPSGLSLDAIHHD
jgi:hypothetical protein